VKLNAKDITVAVIEHESKFHAPWSDLFKLELLAVGQPAAQECINGRGHQTEQKRKAGKAALSAITKWLRERNIHRAEVEQYKDSAGTHDQIESDNAVAAEGTSTTASAHNTLNGNFNFEESRVFQRTGKDHRIAPGTGTGFNAPPESAARAAIARARGIEPATVTDGMIEAWQEARRPRAAPESGWTAEPPKPRQDTGTAQEVRKAMQDKNDAMLRVAGVIPTQEAPKVLAPMVRSREQVVRIGPDFTVSITGRSLSVQLHRVRAWKAAWGALNVPFWTPEASDAFCEIFDIPIIVRRKITS
jgi:hypothetical protein